MSQTFLEQFEQFCRGKNPDTVYDYTDGNHCAVSRFAEFMGMEDEYLCISAEFLNLDSEYRFARMERLAMQEPWTYGALAERVRIANEEEES